MGMIRDNDLKYTAQEVERKSNGYAMAYIEQLKANISGAVKTFEESVTKSLEDYEARITGISGAVDALKTDINSFKTEINESFQVHEEAVASIINEHEFSVEQQITQHKEEVKKVIQEHEETVEATVQAHEEAVSLGLENKADKTEVPTKVSELENDNGYLTEHQDISGKADKTEVQALRTEHEILVLTSGDRYMELKHDKADKSTTLEGYGITDAYTKDEVDNTVENGKNFVIAITEDDNGNSYSDKSYEEIKAAIENGQSIYINAHGNEYEPLMDIRLYDDHVNGCFYQSPNFMHIIDINLDKTVTFNHTKVFATFEDIDLVDRELLKKADKSTTLEGYGITDAYTKDETDSLIGDIETALDNIIAKYGLGGDTV